MDVTFKFHMPASKVENLCPGDYSECDSIDALKTTLLDGVEMPAWNVAISDDELKEFWAEVQQVRAAAGL